MNLAKEILNITTSPKLANAEKVIAAYLVAEQVDSLTRTGYYARLEDISKKCGMAAATVSRNVLSMEKKGVLTIDRPARKCLAQSYTVNLDKI